MIFQPVNKLKNITAKLPPNFSEEVNRNRRFPPRPVQQLKADPGTIEDDEEDEEQAEDPDGRGVARFLWPFTVSISKHKGGHGHDHDFDHGPHQ